MCLDFGVCGFIVGISSMNCLFLLLSFFWFHLKCVSNALRIVLLPACVTDSGNILQIVSAPGQQIIRPQGSMVMQTMPQAVPASNASANPVTLQPPLSTPQQGDPSALTRCCCGLSLIFPVIYSFLLFILDSKKLKFVLFFYWCLFHFKQWVWLQMPHRPPPSSLLQLMLALRSVLLLLYYFQTASCS